LPCYTPLGGWQRPDGTLRFSRLSRGTPDVVVPCGKCIGCRLDYSREWAIRLTHEQQTADNACWLTLTYDQTHLPSGASLSKKDWRDFSQKLYSFSPGVRHYAVGEYGEKKKRPHFHVCLFNCVFPERRYHYTTDSGYPVDRSPVLSKLWGKGNADISDLTAENAAYTARYTIKKVDGPPAYEHYKRFDDYGNQYWVEPEFSRQSNNPGLGFDFYQKFGERIRSQDSVIWNGHEVPVPRYYDKLTERLYPREYEQIKKRRLAAIDVGDPEKTLARRTSKQAVKRRAIKPLTRPLE